MSESKLDSDESKSPSPLDLIRELCLSTEFEREFEDFAEEHYSVFASAEEMKEEGDEHPLEFYDVYNKYIKTFEGRIEKFLKQVSHLPVARNF